MKYEIVLTIGDLIDGISREGWPEMHVIVQAKLPDGRIYECMSSEYKKVIELSKKSKTVVRQEVAEIAARQCLLMVLRRMK